MYKVSLHDYNLSDLSDPSAENKISSDALDDLKNDLADNPYYFVYAPDHQYISYNDYSGLRAKSRQKGKYQCKLAYKTLPKAGVCESNKHPNNHYNRGGCNDNYAYSYCYNKSGSARNLGECRRPNMNNYYERRDFNATGNCFIPYYRPDTDLPNIKREGAHGNKRTVDDCIVKYKDNDGTKKFHAHSQEKEITSMTKGEFNVT